MTKCDITGQVHAPLKPASEPAEVDTPEFQRILGSYVEGVAGQWELVAHIATFGAQQREAGRREKQAEIDRLTLEFCPDEMTYEQKAEWAINQHPTRQSVSALTDEQTAGIAAQCLATASSELATLVEVDGGRGTLRELLLDAHRALIASSPAKVSDDGHEGCIKCPRDPLSVCIYCGRIGDSLAATRLAPQATGEKK